MLACGYATADDEIPEGDAEIIAAERDAVLSMATTADCPPPVPMISLGSIENAFARWQEGNEQGIVVLTQRQEALNSGGPREGHMAMVTNGERISYVHWYNVGNRYGVNVSIDDRQRAVFPVPATHRAQYFNDETIIHPTIGIDTIKGPASWRPTVPIQIQRLRKMWSCVLGGGVPAECTLCGRLSVHTHMPVTCPCCLLSWHRTCEDQMKATLSDDDVRASLPDSPLDPNVFADVPDETLCYLCVARAAV